MRLDTADGPIVLELYPDKAPITAGNFLRYVDEKRFDKAVRGSLRRVRMLGGDLGLPSMHERHAHPGPRDNR